MCGLSYGHTPLKRGFKLMNYVIFHLYYMCFFVNYKENTMWEMPKIFDLASAYAAFKKIIATLLHNQYSGQDEGNLSTSRRQRKRRLFNQYADEFIAICAHHKRMLETEEKWDKAAKWEQLIDLMFKEKEQLVESREKIANFGSYV